MELQGEALGHQVAVLKAGGPAVEGHGQARQEDEQRTASGVKDELGGGVLAFFPAPDRQEQIDRQQLQLPGQEEQQHVLDSEDGDLAAIHRQQQEIEQPGLEAHGPGRQHGQGRNEAGQQDQRHGDPVGSNRPGEPHLREPADPLHQLQIRVAGVVPRQIRPNGDQKGDQGHAQGKPADLFAIPLVRDKRNAEGRCNREQDRGAEPRECRAARLFRRYGQG